MFIDYSLNNVLAKAMEKGSQNKRLFSTLYIYKQQIQIILKRNVGEVWLRDNSLTDITKTTCSPSPKLKK